MEQRGTHSVLLTPFVVEDWMPRVCAYVDSSVLIHSGVYLSLQQTGIEWKSCAMPLGYRGNTEELIFWQGECIEYHSPCFRRHPHGVQQWVDSLRSSEHGRGTCKALTLTGDGDTKSLLITSTPHSTSRLLLASWPKPNSPSSSPNLFLLLSP